MEKIVANYDIPAEVVGKIMQSLRRELSTRSEE